MPCLDHRALVWVVGAAKAAGSAVASTEEVLHYRVQDLGGLMAAAGLNVFDSHLEDINNTGIVVGGGRGASPLFVIEQGRLNLLPVDNAVSEGRATAVNERARRRPGLNTLQLGLP